MQYVDAMGKGNFQKRSSEDANSMAFSMAFLLLLFSGCHISQII